MPVRVGGDFLKRPRLAKNREPRLLSINNQALSQHGKRKVMKEFNSEVIFEVDGLKISSKMKKSIEKLEKQYGKLNKRFFIERDERVRVGNGFYDGCQLTDDIIKSRNIVVAHDGTIS